MIAGWNSSAGIACVALGLAAPATSVWSAPPSGGAVVLVTRAVSSCFSDVIRVTGFLVPREEAMVRLDADGYRLAEILVAEGDRVKAGQDLVRLARIDMPGAPDAPAQGRAQAAPPPPPASITLRAPAAGLITRSSAVVGATASLRAEPLFRIMINNEL